MKEGLFLVVFLLFLPSSLLAGEWECDEATDKLNTYQSEWKKAKNSGYKKRADDAVQDFIKEKESFDGLYYSYMSSPASVVVGVLANQAKTVVGVYKYVLSKMDPTGGVASSAIFCTSDVAGDGLSELVSYVNSDYASPKKIITKMNDTASSCMIRAAYSMSSPGGSEVVALEELALNLERNYTMASSRVAALEEYKAALDTIERNIEKHQNESAYHQYMLDQHRIVESELKNNQTKACDDKAIASMDDLFIGEASDKDLFFDNDEDLFAPSKETHESFDFVAAAEDIQNKRNQRLREEQLEQQRQAELERQESIESANNSSSTGSGFGGFMESLLGAAVQYQQYKNIYDDAKAARRSNSSNNGSSGGNNMCLKQLSAAAERNSNRIHNSKSSPCDQAKNTKLYYKDVLRIAQNYCRGEAEYNYMVTEARNKIKWANDTGRTLGANGQNCAR